MIEDFLDRAVELHWASKGLPEIFPIELPGAQAQVVDRFGAGFGQVHGQHESPLLTPHCLPVLGGRCLGDGPQIIHVSPGLCSLGTLMDSTAAPCLPASSGPAGDRTEATAIGIWGF